MRGVAFLALAVALALVVSSCGASDSGLQGKLVAGGGHTCDLINGQISCWGSNRSGQVGLASTDEEYLFKTEPVDLGETAVDIALGGAHTCAVGESGKVFCWGDNEHGQLGYETTRGFSRTPEVVDLQEAVAIAAGEDHTCAVLTNGGVRCWGSNYNGELGNGQLDEEHITFVERTISREIVAGLRDVVQVEAGDDTTCAVTIGGELYCWGYHFLTDENEALPVLVDSLPAAAKTVVVGREHTCVLLDDGQVYCWGFGAYGQLGDGRDHFEDVTTEPQPVPGLEEISHLAAGTVHTCGIGVSGTAYCWGFNTEGQVGVIAQHTCLLTDPCQLKPAEVEVLPDEGEPISITAGGRHSCVLFESGSAACWGSNSSGQLGSGNDADSLDPVMVVADGSELDDAVSDPEPDAGTEPARAGAPSVLVAGESHNCDITEGVVTCWGSNHRGAIGVDYTTEEEYFVPFKQTSIDLGEPAIDLALGRDHTCALVESGAVYCWGSNRLGQLGAETVAEIVLRPVRVEGLSGVVALGGGDQHTCAVLAAGALRCWGWNHAGQLGNGEASDDGRSNLEISIENVGGLRDVVQVDGGLSHTCALTEPGDVYCWGSNEFGKLGDGGDLSHSRPEPVLGLPGPAVAIALGEEHSCALVEGGTMYCWGGNLHGELGGGSWSMFGEINGAPRQVPGLEGVTQITAGEFHTCAVVGAADVYCWGLNDWGQVGFQERHICLGDPCQYEPHILESLSDMGDVTIISGGGRHTCALFANGSESCWGHNASGELGNGTDVSSHDPVTVLVAGEESSQ